MTRRSGWGVALSLALIGPSDLAAQPGWRVDPVPVLRISGTTAKGDVAFGRADWATRLNSGVVVVADGATPALQFFDAAGLRIRTAGRMGEGPGEFGELTWVGQCAEDSLFAWDAIRQRVTVLDASGAVRRTFRPASVGRSADLACNRNGVMALRAVARASSPPVTSQPLGQAYSFARLSADVFLADAHGAQTADIGAFTIREYVTFGRGGVPRPLGGTLMVALSTERLFLATGEPRIETYSLDGTKSKSIALALRPRAPTRAQYESAAAFILRKTSDQVRRQMLAQLLEVPMPDHLPPFSAMFADHAGLLWLVLSVPGDSDTRLLALGADGQRVAELTIPVYLTIFEIGAGYVLGAHEDEQGEQQVVVYRLQRGR